VRESASQTSWLPNGSQRCWACTLFEFRVLDGEHVIALAKVCAVAFQSRASLRASASFFVSSACSAFTFSARAISGLLQVSRSW